MPERLRLSRRAGYRKPDGAINVARPGPYGNPFPWKGDWIMWTAVALGYRGDERGRRACAKALHRAWLTDQPVEPGPMAQPGAPTGGVLEFTGGHHATMNDHCRGIAAFAARLSEPPTLPAEKPDLAPLAGADVLCWCGPDDPCHGDTLLELANPCDAA